MVRDSKRGKGLEVKAAGHDKEEGGDQGGEILSNVVDERRSVCFECFMPIRLN